mgnify:CR=1 FL=1
MQDGWAMIQSSWLAAFGLGDFSSLEMVRQEALGECFILYLYAADTIERRWYINILLGFAHK